MTQKEFAQELALRLLSQLDYDYVQSGNYARNAARSAKAAAFAIAETNPEFFDDPPPMES